jgi:LemA protein
MVGIILLVLLIGVVLYIIGVYNGLQSLKTQIVASIQEIGNQLKRQASLIPNLESSVKAYMKHEKGVFEMLTDARKSIAKAQDTGKAADIDKAIDRVTALAPAFSIAVEDNPELKANETVTQFMNELTDTADKLMYARRSLIDLSQAYNQKLVLFPSNIIAGVFSFQPEKGLGVAMAGSHVEVSDSEMKDVKVNL